MIDSGVLIVKDKGGILEHRFEITATHTSPIPEDTYAMIHIRRFESLPDCGWGGWANAKGKV